MGYSIKYLNNTASPVSVTITSTSEFTGYLGSVTMAAYSALTTNSNVSELEWLAANRTIDKYLNSVHVYFPGATGYIGSRGYSGSVSPTNYTGSKGATGFRAGRSQ